MEGFLIFIAASLLIEAVVTNIKWVLEGGYNWPRITALVVGIGVAVIFQLDLFAALTMIGIVPFVGFVLTGIILARGANFVNDLITALFSIKTGSKDISSLLEKLQTYQIPEPATARSVPARPDTQTKSTQLRE
ncbi:hypothetical protein ADN00_15645 [Ornatilinea apprima]|uniref:Uncharacterized protein n=1 Tax=Ornatilinea apprima TaxID=1134406 RepID=A0A0P6XRG0_9CHLR|nr:hypothetical protein [Ornatilinea apprima]KPL72249.1 hypothetical protein ADN00_15645 [Ornatilinea apprima]